MLDADIDTVLLPDTLSVPVLHTVGVRDEEAEEQAEADRVPVMQDEGVSVLQGLADWESDPEDVSVPEAHAVELTVELVLTVRVPDTVGDTLPVEQDVEETVRLLVPLRLLLTVTLCVDVTETVSVTEGVKEELMEGELDWVEDRLLLIVPLTVLVPLLQ